MDALIKAIRCGTLIKGTGEPPIKNGVVVIEGSKITAVGVDAQIPSGAKVIDASGKTVMPGLIDTHVHLGMVETPRSQMVIEMLKAPISLLVLYAAKHAREMLEAGFTTCRDLGPTQYLQATPSLSLRKAIELGIVPGCRIMVAGVVSMSAGHYDMFRPSNWPRPTNEMVDGVWAVRKRVRELIRENVDLIKTCAGGGVAGEGEEIWWRNYTVEELQAIVDEAHAQRRKVAAHVYTAPLIKNALEAGIDTIEHGCFLDDEIIEMMLHKGTFLVPTLTVYSERNLMIRPDQPEYLRRKAREVIDASIVAFKKAHKAGIKIAMGTDLFIQYPPAPMFGDNAYELELYVRYGMSEMEAILTATKIAAEALGRDQLGTLEEEKLADIIIINGDPLKNIKILQDRENIRMVIRNGEIAVNKGL
ncbi:MAG: amidohydrolase family protein [Nitrososphaeria archaeon]|nr:amidohydrolase family protein [Nitrososphaeria archaeon]NIN53459.1 amidohydrolase family protein [Nitrososphaeria archaeon]NIQ33979.1 amidohydrolase family protein [Nitrososphaeria archaeon]